MSIKYDKVEIRVSELQTKTVTVPSWETAILQAIYAEDAEVVGSEVLDRVPPEAGDEFARLATRYGPKNEKIPTVASVYGSFGPGVHALAAAIQKGRDGVAVDQPVPEKFTGMSDEMIDKISKQGDDAQALTIPDTKIIEPIDPNPPIASTNPAVESVADLL